MAPSKIQYIAMGGRDGRRESKFRPRRLIPPLALVLVLYLAGGMLIPFALHPEVGERTRAAWDPVALSADVNVDRAALVTDNQAALDTRLRMISEARERIILASFDIRDCESARDIFAALLAAADRGVNIQILWDGMSGLLRGSAPMFRVLGRLDNVEIRFYNEPNFLLPWTVNGRMHDKYLIVDDRLLLLGGRNTFDLFLGDYVPEDRKSHDNDVLVLNTAAGTGGRDSVLWQVEDYFYALWEGPHVKTVLDTQPLLPGGVDGAEAQLRARYEAMAGANPALFSPEEHDYEAETVPVGKITLLSNPTGILVKEPVLWWQLQQLMLSARERVYIQTPYAVLGGAMYDGLGQAADRGVPVELQLNSVAVGDNFVASSDYIHNREKILDTGVTVWEWFGDYSSHGKAALIDGDLSLVGSYNLDMRSTYIDTELMLVFHGEEFYSVLEAALEEMEKDSLQVLPGGDYRPKEGLAPRKPTGFKAVLFPVTSLLLQPFRFLA